MIVISDTTPLISLMKINQLSLLEKLFGYILIPQAVYEELINNPDFIGEANQIKAASFIKVTSIKNQNSVSVLMRVTGLDLGESEAIILTEEIENSSLLIDERKGRRIAEMMGFEITGTLGILLNAHRERLITTQEAITGIDQMRLAGIRISDKVYSNYLDKLKNGNNYN